MFNAGQPASQERRVSEAKGRSPGCSFAGTPGGASAARGDDEQAMLLGRSAARSDASTLDDYPVRHLPPASHLPGLSDVENRSELDSFVEEEEFSREQLQMIKARTMFQMVEELEGGSADTTRKYAETKARTTDRHNQCLARHSRPRAPCRHRLLFLTNPQAELLASSSASLQQMLNALQLPKPKLVINLLMSQGFNEYCSSYDEAWAQVASAGPAAGVIKDRPPFLDSAAEKSAEEQIDRFMAEVLIPLAAQTNAIVLCSATPNTCILSASLTRMYAVERAKWGARAPFTIISATAAVQALYCNPDEQTTWREIRKASRAWRQRNGKLTELIHRQFADDDGRLPRRDFDLDPNAMCYVVVDGIEEKKGRSGPPTRARTLRIADWHLIRS